MTDDLDPDQFRAQFDARFDAGAAERVRERVLAHIAANPRGSTGVGSVATSPGADDSADVAELALYTTPDAPVRSARRRRWVVPAAVCAVAAAVVAVVMFSRSVSPDSSAALGEIASAAQHTDALELPNSVVITDSVTTPQRTSEVVIEVDADGHAQVRRSDETPDPVTSAARQALWVVPGDVEGLADSPSELIDEVAARLGAGRGSVETANALAHLSAMPYADPGVRAAAVEALGVLGAVPFDDALEGAPPGEVFAGPTWWVVLDPDTGAATGFGWSQEASEQPDVWRTWTVEAE